MRICLVSQEYPPETAHGGIGTQTWNKAEGFTRRGHEVEVLSCGSDAGPEFVTADEAGVTVHRMRPPGTGIPVQTQSAYLMGYSWAVLQHLSRIVKNTDFDIVNFPEYAGEGFAFFLNRTAETLTPTVVQMHGPLEMFNAKIGWPERDTDLFQVGTLMERICIERAGGLMASSSNIADFASDAYGVDRSTVHVVHCGINADLFRPAPRHEDNRRPTILFAGNLERSKGLQTVFEAVLAVRTSHPDVLLRILGRGNNELVRAMEQRARDVGADGNLEFLGFVRDRSRLPEIYQSADIFASPAEHEVGVANVYVEAMACGCPVVASHTGGAPEAITDGVNGLLVPPRDVDATAAAFEVLLGDTSTRTRIGAAARERVEQYFAQDHYLDRVMAAYEATIARSTAHH